MMVLTWRENSHYCVQNIIVNDEKRDLHCFAYTLLGDFGRSTRVRVCAREILTTMFEASCDSRKYNNKIAREFFLTSRYFIVRFVPLVSYLRPNSNVPVCFNKSSWSITSQCPVVISFSIRYRSADLKFTSVCWFHASKLPFMSSRTIQKNYDKIIFCNDMLYFCAPIRKRIKEIR